MASRDSHDGNLDATTDREVVFCHACSYGWYRDDLGLMCPHCESETTEIVSADDDPQNIDASSNSIPSDSPLLCNTDDSDLNETDIDEHIGPQGFHCRQSTQSGMGNRHHDPSVDPVFQRFSGMIQGFGQPRRNEGTGLFSRAGNGSYGPSNIQQTTYRSPTFDGGTAGVMMFSSPAHAAHSRGSHSVHDHGHPDPNNLGPFQAVFPNVIRDMRPPEGAGGGGPDTYATGLIDILFRLGDRRLGSGVLSQEEHDTIITQLMEANPPSNAAPPATEETLTKIDRKTVDKELLGPDGKVECSICIDEMKEGETVAFLPCRHWFHEDCVVLWLKEHNTCPVCRTPIEKNERGQGHRRESNTGGPDAPGPSNDTSRLQRRTSHSPTSPRAANLAEQGARMRQRSPSATDRRGSGEREPRRQSGALH